MTLGGALIAAGLGAAASAINAVAGGGSLVTFPALTLGFGLPSVPANATNTAAMWPGSLAGGIGFLNLFGDAGRYLKPLLLPTVLGSVLGAALLLSTSSRVFDLLVPPLILLAATLLVFQPRIKAWTLRRRRKVSPLVGGSLQFLVSVYGGYFGAGMGIMMLAALALYVDGDIHAHNAIKNWLGLLINFTATFLFLWRGEVAYGYLAPLVVGSLIGGYVAARLSQRANADVLRLCIAAYGFFAAGYFIYRLVVR